MFGLKGNKKRNYRSNLTAGNAMGRWLRPGLAAAVFAAGAFGALGPRSAANAQELNDLLRGGVGIILQEIDRQQRINRRQQTEKPAPRARKAQEQRQPDAARSGADRATVARIQAQLAELGYDPGPVDGAMGPRTRRAIIAFQRDNGLARTGAANKATAAAVQTAYNLASRAGKPSAGAAALGPSFDCTRAATLSERAICADPRLAARDLELTRLYGDAIAGAGAARAGALRAEQQAWLTRRDRCGADASCIGMRMEERIATLAATAGVGAQASRPGGASSTALTARGASAVGSDANAEQPFAASSDYAAAVALALQDHARAYLDLGPAAVIDHKLATADPATCASLAREIEAMAADAFLARATLDRWTPEFRSALAAASAKPKRATHVLHVRSSLGPYDFASSGFPINNAPFLGAADTRLRAVRMRLAERDAEAPPCTKAGSYAIGRILQSLGESGARLNRTRLPYLEASIEPLDAKAFLPMAPAQAQALVERYRASSAAPFVNIALAVELAGPVNPFAALPARVLAVRIHDGQTGALLHEASPEPPAPQDGVAEGTIRDYALIAFRSDLDAYRRAPELNGLVLEAADNDEETCRRTRGIIRSNDQFAIRDHLAQAARRFEAALPEIEAANGPFEREFAIERPMPLGQYDFARQAFTFEWSSWIQGVVEPGAFALAGDVVTGCKMNLLGITTLAARHLARLNGGGGGGQWLNLDGLHVRHDGAPWAATLPIAEDKARAILAAGVRSVAVVARVRFGPRETQGPGPLPGKIVSVEFRSAESGETLGVVRRPDSTPQEDAAVPAQGGVQPLTPELATRMVLPLISRIDDEARVYQRLEHAVRQAQSLIASGRPPSDLPLPLSEIRDRPPAVVVSRHRDALLAALGKASLRLPMQVSLRSTTSAHYTAHDGKLKVHYGPPAAWQSQSGAKDGRIFVPAMLDFGARRAAQDRPPLFGAFVADGLFQTAFLLDKTLREDVLDLPVEEAVRRGFGGGARRDEIEAEVILDVADVRLAEAGVAIIEADLKRVVLRWKSDGAVLADFDFSTRPTQAEEQAASAPRSAAELPLSPPPPGAPMTAEITDLLHVRMLPESLDDRHYTRMMLSRHSYERRLSQRGQEPEWGRFFVAADDRLDADAVAAQLPTFKAWTMARAKAVPTRLTVNLPLHAGISSFIRRGDSGAQLKSACRNMARSHQAGTRKAVAGAMLCDYLRKAWNVPDDHLFLEADAPFAGARTPSRPRGPRGACGGDFYCRNMADAMKFAGLVETDAYGQVIMPTDLVRLDRTPRIDPQRHGTLPGASLSIELEITGVEQLETWPDTAWQAAIRAARPFAMNAGIDRGFRGLFAEGERPRAPTGALRWEAKALSARIIDRSGALVEELALAPPPPLPLDALKEAEPPRADAWDVVGLTLGMPFSEAEAAIRKRLPSGEVLTADRAMQTKAIAGAPEPYSSGKLFVSDDETELIAIYNEPPAAPDRVMAIWRMLRLPAGTIDAASLKTQLEGKYGAPVETKANGHGRISFIWSAFKPEGGCLDISMSHQTGIWAFESGASQRGAFVENRYFPGPGSYRLSSLGEQAATNGAAALSQLESELRGACGPGLTVEMRTRPASGPTSRPEDVGIEIIFVLQDPKTYGHAYLKTLRAKPQGAAPPAEGEGRSKIEL